MGSLPDAETQTISISGGVARKKTRTDSMLIPPQNPLTKYWERFCGGAGYTLLHGCLRLVRLQEGPDAVDRALLELWRLLPGVDRDLGLWRE